VNNSPIDIVIFVLPWEIEAYRSTVARLESAIKLDSSVTLSLHACLCVSVNIIDWKNSKASPQKIIDEYNEINE